MKEELQTELENNQKHDNRIEFKYNCYNKDGKIVKAAAHFKTLSISIICVIGCINVANLTLSFSNCFITVLLF